MDDQARPGHVHYYFAGFVATSQQPPHPSSRLPTAPTSVQVRKRTPGLVLPRVRSTNAQNSCSPDPQSHYEVYSSAGRSKTRRPRQSTRVNVLKPELARVLVAAGTVVQDGALESVFYCID